MKDANGSDYLIRWIESKYGKEKAAKLILYVEKILDRNKHVNLTAVRDFDEAIQKHVLDSLSVTEIPEYKSAHKIIDIGTGAGFPGALLAIVSPDKKFVLMDSTLKRLRIIDEFAEELGIKNIITVHSRAEEAARKPEYRGKFDLCVSRAVANLDKLSEWCLPFVRCEGSFAAYKGENYLDELNEAERTIEKNGAHFVRAVSQEKGFDMISGHVILIFKKL